MRLVRPARHAVAARSVVATALAGVMIVAAGACGTSSSGGGALAGKIDVVAAEGFWGSIAAQLGGERVEVTSIVTSPDTDPHDYEPRAQDGRAVATARYVIYNGVGYDPWAAQLVAANDTSDQTVLDIGKFLGVAEGGNPHLWYSPPDVERVVNQVSADYKRVDPAGAPYFDRTRADFESTGLQRYHDLVAGIRARYTGVPVAASESIFTPMAEALGLDLKTPESFLDAISEGTEPTAQGKATADSQIRTHQVKVYVYNSQNSTPDVKVQVDLANASGIPVVEVTETPTPVNSAFQDWQVRQLDALQTALSRGTSL